MSCPAVARDSVRRLRGIQHSIAAARIRIVCISHPMQFSGQEIARFAKLHPMNARPVQPLDGERSVMRAAKNCVVLAALCLMAACATTQTRSPPSESTRAASFQTIPCPQPNIAGFPDLDFPSGVECGYLTVLENRAKPDGRRIRIFVMRAPAVSATPKPDPIVYLSGGPGGAGSFEVAFMVKHGLNADREVIFVDQRGTHRADPLLGCPGWEQFLFDSVSVPFAAESTTAADAAALKECRDRLAATGVDLAAYNSTENAADIADLRVALGIDSWNVYGVSYGSKLALIVLRDHPQGIRSVVLDSVSPPTNNIVETWWSAPASSFKAIFAACAAQAACATAYPNLEADFTATVNRLDTTPVVAQVKDESGSPVTVNIDGFAFAYTLIMTSERGDASGIPKMIADMARGDSGAVAAAYLALRGPPEFVGLGGIGLALDRVLRGERQSHDRGSHVGEGEGGAPRIPGPGAAGAAQTGTTLHRVPDLERRKGGPGGERPNRERRAGADPRRHLRCRHRARVGRR